MKMSYKYAELRFVEVELTAWDVGQLVLKHTEHVPKDFTLERMETDEDSNSINLVFRKQIDKPVPAESETDGN